jgi:hypothetical protein
VVIQTARLVIGAAGIVYRVRARDSESARVRLAPDVKVAWEKVLTEHNITQQAAMVALVRFAVRQDPLARSMIFGQVPDTDHAALSRIVLERLGRAKGKK